MTLLIAISAVSAALGLMVGVAVLMQNQHSRLHQLFFLLSISIAVFALAEFGYRLSENTVNAQFWLRIHHFAPLLISLIFLFAAKFTESARWVGNRYLMTALFASAILFSVIDNLTNSISGNLVYTSLGWEFTIPRSIWYHVFAVWSSALLIVASFLCVRFYFRPSDRRRRLQAKYVAFSIILISVVEVIIDTGLPYINIQFPELTTFGYVCADILIAYAIWRHKLFVLNPTTAADTILETMSDSLFLISPDGTVKYANSAAAALFAGSSESLSGRSFRSLFSAEERPRQFPDSGEFSLANPIRDVPAHALCPDGRTIPVSLAGRTMRDATGAVVGTVVAARDITERVAADQALKESYAMLDARVHQRTEELSRVNQILAEERERLAVTLRSIGDGVIATDIKGAIIFMNNAAEHLTGYRSTEAIARPVWEVLRVSDRNDRSKLLNPVNEVFRTGGKIEMVPAALLTARNGTECVIDDSAAPIRSTSGDIIGGVVVFRDITEREKLEQELFKAKRLESVGILAGGIAHDFNNLLTGINNSLFLCKISAGANSEIIAAIDKAEHEILRAQRLSMQLLTFAHGGEPLLATGSLHALVRESIGFFLSGSNCDYELDFSADLMNVMMDKGMMEQVLGNLVMNAEEAMHSGGTIFISGRNTIIDEKRVDLDNRMTVHVSPGVYVRLTITDTGVGIPGNIHDQIFDPFFSTKGKGRGLGLSIVQSIVKKHGGAIIVDSQNGTGASFSVYLPAVEVSTPEQMEDKSEYDPISMENCYERILLMDDEETIRQTTGKILERLGYRVGIAANGEEAVALFQSAIDVKDPFDLVILDLTVPGGMGGKECIREIKKIDPSIKALVASGYSNDSVMADFSSHGFNDVLRKPYSIRHLAEVIRSVLDRHV